MQTATGKVILKLSSTFASMLNVKASSLVSVEYAIHNGATIGSMLKELVNDYPSLQNYLFNSDGTEVNERIDVVLNSTLIKGKNIAGTGIHDGDTLFLLPVYEGG
jgi:hypothetical protein